MKHCEKCDCPDTASCFDYCHMKCSCCFHHREKDIKATPFLWGYIGFFIIYGMFYFIQNVMMPFLRWAFGL